MKVIEGDQNEDSKGRYPIIFKGYKSISEVHDWLFRNYNGYHFVIIIDETHDEWEPFGELKVYFSDEALDEIAAYAGKKVVKA